MSIWHSIRAAFERLARPVIQRIYVPRSQAGVLVTEDTALTLAEWWACVNVIARTIAALPWHVYERTENGRKAIDGAIAWLLNNQPNEEMTAFSFRETLMGHVLNWGNAYAEIQRDLAGRVTALWILTPDRVTVRRNDAGKIVYHVRSYDAEDVELTADQVLHIHGLGFDGLVGYSLVQMAARSIGLGIAQDTFSAAFYQNGTVMGTVIEMPGHMTRDQIKESEAYYNGQHGGPGQAFKVKVAPPGIKVNPMGMPLTDAQFVESRQLTVTMAARWIGVPPHKIADLTRSTDNNIEHQGIEFVTDAIVPWAVRFEQEANVKLFSSRAQGRVYTKLSANALMRGDSAARAAFYRTMTAIGAMSINEVRELEDLNGIGAAGDQHLVQLNQTTLEWLVDHPDAKANAAVSPAPGGSQADPPAGGEPVPTNVIRAQALEWARAQRKQA